ncbi:DUF4417 domain-containing protein [Amycolatopsis japonica]|uniref:DUF4417 domain-containing protein n=1 Tax=Amycolatopsis japonica TaxID=208439 RepID=UPI003670D23C
MTLSTSGLDRPDVLADTPPPELGGGGTRTSHRWATMPGNWDKLNCRALWPTDNLWGIPTLPRATFEPARLVAYTDRHAAATAGPGAAVHFFLDDYRFEVVWSKPERGLSRCRSVGAALTPDFSLYRDMPLVMQLWQVYRSRWCGAWLLHHGVTVVPTVSWSTADSYDFAFAGIPPRSVVAVSTVGVWRDPVARGLFAAGYAEMLLRLEPALVLVHGKPPTEQVRGATPIQCYPSRWDGDR